jgi:Chitobiase/beta-hexosaminidase C-terminal domain
MRAIWTILKYLSRSCTSVSTALVFVLAMCLSGVVVARAQVPASGEIVLNQATLLGALPSSGGSQSGGEPAGDTMAVNSNGDLIATDTFGNDILLFTPQGTTPTVLGSISNPNGVAVDSQNNLYIGLSYTSTVLKIPYVNGTYAAIAATSSSTPNCTGSDTAECIMSNVSLASGSGVVSMVFDAKGDMFFGTTNQNQEGNNPNSIYECTVACLNTGSPVPTLLFTELTASAPNTTGQLSIGGLALDAAGDVFFTDSAIGTANNQESFSSNVKELVITSGTYATDPTVIYAYAPSVPVNFGAEIDGVAVTANGTVYALFQGPQATQMADPSIVAFPEASGGTYSSSTAYLVSTQNGKLMTSDAFGNLYIADDGGNIYEITLDNVTAAPSAVGVASTATNITTILNDGGCTTPPMVSFTPTGTAASAFSAATTGTCMATVTTGAAGASYATTLSFTPAAVGTVSATLTLADNNGSQGTATVSGNGTGTVATPAFSLAGGTYTGTQTVTITDATVGTSIYYTTDGSTPGANTGTSTLYSGPITVSASETVNAIAVDAGDTSSAIAMAAYVINVPGGSATPTFTVAAGTYTTPQQIIISDTSAGVAIYYTTDGSTPGAGTGTSILYSGPIAVTQTETINAIATGGGFGNSGIATALYTIDLPASAFQNVVMSQVTEIGPAAVPSAGGSQSGSVPAGDSMAVNSLGDVIFTDTFGNETLLLSPGVTTPTVLGTTSNPNGVAVDSQNNLFMGFSYSPTVVKVPYSGGTTNAGYAAISVPTSSTPNCTGSDTAECVMSNLTTGSSSSADIVSLLFDAAGDLFYSTGNASGGAGTSNAIFECTAACLYTGTPAAKLIFVEPTASAPSTAGQLNIGGMAFDAQGDLFFTDSAVSSTTTQESFSSNLNELVNTSGTYATDPTVIYHYAPTAVSQYGAEIDGVAVAGNGTVYIVIQAGSGTQAAAPGVLAFPLVSGMYSSSTSYLAAVADVSSAIVSLNGKSMTNDALGNLYIADDSGNIYEVAVDNLTAATAPVQNPTTTTNIYTILNDGGCTATPPTVTFAVTGTAASAFSAATTGTCTATTTLSSTGGAAFATTLTFTPTAVGTNSATLTATDSLNNTGVAAASGAGTPAPPAATPAFSVVAGTYTTVQTVTITDTSTAASIYYTTDGSTPTSSSTLYTAPITVGVTETLNAIATGNGFATSPVATALYTVNLPAAATPTFSVAAGTYTTAQTVSIADTSTGVLIYYTTDGSTPGNGTGTSVLYGGPITVSSTETINAIAVPSSATVSFTNSAVATALYTVNLPVAATPTFLPAAGTYEAVQTVTIADATAGAAIYYTTDGSMPMVGSGTAVPYSGSIQVAATETINAIAVATNYSNSAMATAAYTITLPAPALTITSSDSTVTATAGGTGTVTLTITANAAFNGTMGFACSGFLPIGATCAFSPTSLTVLAGANSTTTLTVAVPAATAALHHGPSPLLPGSMMAAALCILGFRKRRRLQMLLLFVVSAIGLTMFNGCTTTSSKSSTSGQFVVTVTGVSCPVTDLTCASMPQAPPAPQPTSASTSIPLILTVQ